MKEYEHLLKKSSRRWERSPEQAKAASIHQVLQALRPPLSGASLFSPTPIQRVCGAPGCTDPNCHDTKNHGIDRVWRLRGGTIICSANLQAADRSRGTPTTPATRAYVRDPQTPRYPYVSTTYSSDSGNTQGHSFMPNDTSGPVDAGHIIGRQNGGYGNDRASVFVQNRDYNQGHDGHHGDWRKHEDQINKALRSGENVQQTVKFYQTPPLAYSSMQQGRPVTPVVCRPQSNSHVLRYFIMMTVAGLILYLFLRRR